MRYQYYSPQISRRRFLASAPCAISASLSAAQSRRPNFVVILTDDQGYGDLGCNGAADVKTPNLDRLAASGVRFADWHSNSPVCSPSRASVLTGQYPQHCGVPEILASTATFDTPGLRAGQRTLASELNTAGYQTAAIGKWHLGSARHSRPQAQGFDDFFGFYSGWTDYHSHRYYQLGGNHIMHDMWRGDTEVFEDPLYQTELLSREANSFLARQSTAKPFFLYLTFGAPHYPMIAPKKYLDRFPATMDRDRRMHLAMIAAVDDAVGTLVATLKSRGTLDNTVIFFQADNGATSEVRADHRARPYRGGSNGPLRAFKGSLFEGGHRVPALMSWPARLKPGQVRREMGVAMDLLPTLLSFAGLKPPEDVDGADLSRALIEAGEFPARDVFWNYAGQTAMRRGHWKLIDKHREGLGEKLIDERWLSNLDADLSETTNAAAQNPDRVRDMMDAMRSWRARYNL